MERLISLDPDTAFELRIGIGLHNFIKDKNNSYHLYVSTENIIIEEEHSENRLVFDTSKLKDTDKADQLLDAIVAAYQYMFAKLGDLDSRLDAMQINQNSEPSFGSNHSFYHDSTGKYPERVIFKRIMFLDGFDESKTNNPLKR